MKRKLQRIGLILLVMIFFQGTAQAQSFNENGDGTVTDGKTGLVWSSTATKTNWKNAMGYCERLSLGGADDWRLPNSKELHSIVDYSRRDPAIDITAFHLTNSSYYWSSTTWARSASLAWRVYFGNGSVSDRNKSNNHYVRCVRGGQFASSVAAPDFADNRNGTVTDGKTGLVWQKCSMGQTGNADCSGGAATAATWENALGYCKSLSLGGADDWRLPNAKELRSIVDTSRTRPAIDTSAFPNIRAYGYWSSNTQAGFTKDAWIVMFSSGKVDDEKKSDSFDVRCVRGGH